MRRTIELTFTQLRHGNRTNTRKSERTFQDGRDRSFRDSLRLSRARGTTGEKTRRWTRRRRQCDGARDGIRRLRDGFGSYVGLLLQGAAVGVSFVLCSISDKRILWTGFYGLSSYFLQVERRELYWLKERQFWSFPDQNGWSSCILLPDSPQGFAVVNIYWITPLSVSPSILIKSDSIWMGDTVVHLLMMALTLFSLAYICVCSQNIMIIATVSQMVCTSVHLGLGFLYFYPVLALPYHC